MATMLPKAHLTLALIALVPLTVSAQEGELIYQVLCAACHTNPPNDDTPRVDALRLLDVDTIVNALTSGVMRPQGDAMSPEQRVVVAEYLAGVSGERDYVDRTAPCE